MVILRFSEGEMVFILEEKIENGKNFQRIVNKKLSNKVYVEIPIEKYKCKICSLIFCEDKFCNHGWNKK